MYASAACSKVSASDCFWLEAGAARALASSIG